LFKKGLSPLTPLGKGGKLLKVPLTKGDLGGFPIMSGNEVENPTL
jgi:hypothetical protein